MKILKKKTQHLKVFKYLRTQKISNIHQTSLLFPGRAFISRGSREVSHCGLVQKWKQALCTIWTDNSPARARGTITMYNTEVVHVGREFWNLVLALSTLLDGCHLNQVIYLNLVLLERSRTFGELGTKWLRISDLPASKDIENGNFLMSSQWNLISMKLHQWQAKA